MKKSEYYTLDDIDTFGKTAFYQMPKWMFTGKYKSMTNNERCIYSLLSDRFRLSLINGWEDESGRSYVIYSAKEISENLNVSIRTVQRCFAKLVKLKLITTEIITEICENSLKKIQKIFLLKPEIDEVSVQKERQQKKEVCFDMDDNEDEDEGVSLEFNEDDKMSLDCDKMSMQTDMTKCLIKKKDNSINKNKLIKNISADKKEKSLSLSKSNPELHRQMEQLEDNILPAKFNERDRAIVSDIMGILKTRVFSKADEIPINVGNKKEPEIVEAGVLKSLFLEKLNFARLKIYLTQFREYCHGITNPINYHIKSLYMQCLCQSTIYQVKEAVY